MTDIFDYTFTEDADAGSWCQLVDKKTAKNLPVRVRIAGQHSNVWKNAEKEYQKTLADRFRKAGKAKTDPEDVDRLILHAAARSTSQWETMIDGQWKPFLLFQGEELTCNYAAVKRVYREPKVKWIYDQLLEHSGDPSNYGVTPATDDDDDLENKSHDKFVGASGEGGKES